MKTQTMYSPWIDLKASELVNSALITQEEGVQSTPSPYDVPMALRIDEGDAGDPSYAFELLYLGGDERTQRNRIADLAVEIGEKSGRVYRVIIGTKLAATRARADVERIAKQLETGVAELSKVRSANVFMVGKAIEAHAGDLATQLTHLGAQR